MDTDFALKRYLQTPEARMMRGEPMTPDTKGSDVSPEEVESLYERLSTRSWCQDEDPLAPAAEMLRSLSQHNTELKAENERLRGALDKREARRLEILEWLQDEIGTTYECECGWGTYHNLGNECAECGAPFPTLNLLAFKLHANVPDEPTVPSSQETDGEKK